MGVREMNIKKKALVIFSVLLMAIFLSESFIAIDKKVYGATTSIVYPSAPPTYTYNDVSAINNTSQWKTMNVHDPFIYYENGWYYCFSTDYATAATPPQAVQIRKSQDMVSWQWVGTAFTSTPAAAKSWTGETLVWAPDVQKIGSKYYMYYCNSVFGTNKSFIGVATSNSITGPWTDQGLVYKTASGAEDNAIDPNIITDASGRIWMVYGSFFGGIYISEINPATGKLYNSVKGTLLARRPLSAKGAVEGGYITYNPSTGYYYLFCSYDFLGSSPYYSVRVARSKNVTGPYVDYNNNNMINSSTSTPNEIGTKILGSYAFGNHSGWLAPGHNSVFKQGSNFYLVHHARTGSDINWTYLHVRKLLWTDNGWPVASPERYAKESEQTIPSSAIAGTYQSIVLDRNTSGKIGSTNTVLLASGKIGSESSNNHWTLTGTNTLKLYWYAPGVAPGDYWIDTCKVLPSWDWENNRQTLVYTGLNQSGTAIWGKKVS